MVAGAEGMAPDRVIEEGKLGRGSRLELERQSGQLTPGHAGQPKWLGATEDSKAGRVV